MLLEEEPKARSRKNLDRAAHGAEPSGQVFSGQFELINAFNYYQYHHDRKDAIAFLISYLEKTDQNSVKTIKKIDAYKIPTTLGWIARLMSRNCVLPAETQSRFKATVSDLVASYAPVKRQEKAKASDQPKYKEYPYIAELETQLDTFIKNGYESDFKFTEWVRSNEIGPTAVSHIAEYYRPLLAELQAIAKDKALKDAYKLSTKQRNNYVHFIEGLVSNAESILENRKRARAPRKKRTPKVENLIKGLKYLQQDTKLNIASIAPSKIIGAAQLITFNIKTRKITSYVAKTGEKLSLKGSTLLNYDTEKSIEKTVRKPHETIPAILNSGKREVSKVINKLSTTPSVLDNGRINKHCILLSAFT